MKNTINIAYLFLLCFCCSCKNVNTNNKLAQPSLLDVTSNKFLMGVALTTNQVLGSDTSAVKVINQHFNSIVAENCMKSEVIHPEEDVYNFGPADEFVQFGENNNMFIVGHCLIWHSQLSPWFCVDENGNNVSPEVLKQRMKDHIYTIVGRYKGRIQGWDVVNEAIENDGSYRKSKFYEILGEEYIPLAFQYTHEADPNAELYYNDYSMFVPSRRDRAIKLISSLKERGIRIDAIGMQGHYVMGGPTIEEVEESIVKFGETGAKVMFTEFDMALLPRNAQGADISAREDGRDAVNPFVDSLPNQVSQEWNAWMKSYFELFIRHSDIISRVTMWGLTDGDSWLNDWPIKGRTDYPLLFDRNYQPKPFILDMIQSSTNI